MIRLRLRRLEILWLEILVCFLFYVDCRFFILLNFLLAAGLRATDSMITSVSVEAENHDPMNNSLLLFPITTESFQGMFFQLLSVSSLFIFVF
jgi:hypothetical protein